MKVLLISANREEINMRTWPLGMACVAASLQKAGRLVHTLDMLETQDYETAVRNTVAEFDPNVVGISVRNIDDQHMVGTKIFLQDIRAIVETCKAATKAPIVLGGAGYSMYPASLLQYTGADMGIQGEGENALLQLLDCLERGAGLHDIPGLYLPGLDAPVQRSFLKDLDSVPLPDIFMLPHELVRDPNFWVPVQTRRGCPMDCSYCSTASIEGHLLRKRSAGMVAQWLARGARTGFKQYYFVDNTFNLPPSYAKKLCREIIAADLNIVWRCIVYPTHLDAELAELMAASGCREVSLGFENGSEPILHSMNKKFTTDQVRKTADLLAKHGIKRMGFLLLGGPGETKSSALESLRFADSLNLESLRLTVGIRIYPFTKLEVLAREEGVISGDDDLLIPRFYVQKGMDRWLRAVSGEWLSARSNWFC